MGSSLTKKCSVCSEVKSREEFYVAKNTKDGNRSSCKPCNNKQAREWAANNKDKIRQRSKERYKENPLKQKVAQEKWRRDNPEQYSKIQRNTKLKLNYGIDLEEYDRMLDRQEGKCLICSGTDSNSTNTDNLYVDHCHKTNKVRGLLCSHCNSGLGMFKDSIESLERAIQYIKDN